jgi:hypothetical protein
MPGISQRRRVPTAIRKGIAFVIKKDDTTIHCRISEPGSSATSLWRL